MHLVPFVSSALWWKENLERISGRDSELWQSHDSMIGQDCSLDHTASSSKDLEFQQWLLQVVIQREGWGFPQTSGSGSSLEPVLRATLQCGQYLVKMHIPLSGWFGNHMSWNLDLNRLGTNQDVSKMLVIVTAQKKGKTSVRLPVLFRGSFWGHTQNSWKWTGEVTTSVLHTLPFPYALKICSSWTQSHIPGKPLLMFCTSLSRWLQWSSQCT